MQNREILTECRGNGQRNQEKKKRDAEGLVQKMQSTCNRNMKQRTKQMMLRQ